MRKITEAEAEKMIKDSEELTINMFKPFQNSRILWMQKVCKVYRRNRKNLAVSQVNWDNIGLTKTRR